MVNHERVLVTGANGFVGRRLCQVLADKGYVTRRAVRQLREGQPISTDGLRPECAVIGEINEKTDWRRAVEGVDSVIHLAGRAHIMREQLADPLSAYRQVNVGGTSRLASAAATSGVKRLVFVSSIKVNGESTREAPFTVYDVPAPEDAYGVSKWEAEQELLRIASQTQLQVVIVRPPLVYGPGVKGNLLTLMRWIERGWPLPVGGCRNARSLVGLENLVDLLTLCLSDPRAVGQVFLAGDGEDMSTPELASRLAMAMKRKSAMVSVPPAWLRLLARMVGKQGMYDRLCGSLRVDIGHARRRLGWVPPSSVDEELLRMASWFAQRSR